MNFCGNKPIHGDKIKACKPDLVYAMRKRIFSKTHRVLVGIDPGKITGFAVYSRLDKKLLQVESYAIHEALEEVKFVRNTYGIDILVRFEDARQRQYLPKEKNNSEYRGKLMGAGSIQRDCTIWEDFLKGNGIDYEMVPPSSGMTKWSEEYFRKVTAWQKRTSNHARDAAVLVFHK